jgi:putative PIN family toxin of toxin-antitoxin system
LIVSEELLTELDAVWQRPRLQKQIARQDAQDLLAQLRLRGEMVELKTIPPRCRDPQDQPVLATAIDGHADAVVTGDADLRADQTLRDGMAAHHVQLWGIDTLLEEIAKPQ